jgi:hypothetical protein
MRLMAGAPEQVINPPVDAGTPATQVFESRTARGIANPVNHVMRPLRSGESIAWPANDENAATAWVPIATRLFVPGMAIHFSDKITKGDAPHIHVLRSGQGSMAPAVQSLMATSTSPI